jgi:glyoxylase-like metal-dependent hydrolase (beta-lactamase superfamily II)
MSYVHLFVGSEAIMLVDTCLAHNPEQEILPYMQSIGVSPEQLTYILISHSDIDHQGGNQPMKDAAPQAIFMCHNLDRPWIEDTDALIDGRYAQFDFDHGFETTDAARAAMHEETLSAPINMTLEGGEQFRLSPDWYVEAIHTPGHTWGHLAVFDPRSKTMAAGEASLWNAILDENWNPVLPPTYCYVDTYLATQDRLMAMQIDQFSPAHWQLQTGAEVAEFLRESRNYCLHVEAKLLELAQKRRRFTLKEAMEELGPVIGKWGRDGDGLLPFPLTGNLVRLVARGQLVKGRNDADLVIWSLPR